VESVNAEDFISTHEAWLILWNSVSEQHDNKISIQNTWEEVILKFQPLFSKKTGKK
jgi:hypothetical protein